MTPTERKIISRLRDVRTERGLTQQELCDRTGIARHTIAKLEGGVHVPTARSMLLLAETLEVAVEDLFSLAGKRKKRPR